MDRNREARRTSMAASNGISRRRHRSGSLRDSPDEDGPVELPEPARLRDRLKKDRDRDRERDRDRDRDRDRSSRSKRRRGDKLMHGSNREDGGDDTSEESVNEEEEEEYDEDGGGSGSMRTLPPNPVPSISSSVCIHQPRNRINFLASKNFRSAPALKPADEMIGVSVPRKARSASTKRVHDWISGGGGVGGDLIHRQESASPVSPSSSNASLRKKMPNGTKSRPPKSYKPASSSSNPEELEIEVAEVLYGLKTQSQGPSTKEIASNDTAKIDSKEVNKSSSDAKSRVSSPTSNTPSLLPQNSSSPAAPMLAVAPKRKKPRQVSENLGNLSVSSTTMKVEIHQHLNNEISSTPADNGGATSDFPNFAPSLSSPTSMELPVPPEEMKPELSALSTEEARDTRFVNSTKKEVTSPKESSPVGLVPNREDATATVVGTKIMDIESQGGEKYQIDLMAPPPQLKSSPDGEDVINFAAAADSNRMVSSNVDDEMMDKEDDKVGEIGKDELVNVEAEERKAKEIMEETDSLKPAVNKKSDIDLKILEKPDRDGSTMGSDNGNKLQHEVSKAQLQPAEMTAQPNSFPLPMSVTSWPGGLPPMGYMAPLQGLVSMEGSTMSSTPIQPLFSQPRGKRCATHFNIAQNIHYIQQFMKMNPFWPAAAGSAPLFGAKPCNFNVMPPAELHGNITGRSLSSVQDKGQGISVFPGHNEKDKGSQAANTLHSDQRKQQILLQQARPPVVPNNILHGPAIIFPFNQQQAAVAAASARPGSAKSPTTPGNLTSSASNSATVSASATAATAATTMSFNYPNMSVNDTQYLAILQNNAYPFPIPAVGAPPNYRGTHPQAMPLFNGSFYPSQMIHPSQLQQHQPLPSQSHQMQQAHQNTSSGSSSSQKHLQGQQQRPPGSSVNGGSGNFQNFPAPKNRPSQQQNQQHINPPQARQLENEVVGEDSPSTADSRVSSRASMSAFGQNFAMSIHPQNFALMNPPAGLAGASAATGSGNQNEKKHQQPQQQGLKAGVESRPPQSFAMSFAPMNGSSTASGIDISSQFAQNHAIIQSLPQATRQGFQIMAATAAAQAAQRKKHFGTSEEGKAGAGGDGPNVDEEGKGPAVKSPPTAGQSIAFSRSELADASGSASPGNTATDSSTHTLNSASGNTKASRSPMTSALGSFNATANSHLSSLYQHQQQQMIQVQNQKLEQQQVIKLHKLQQHHDQQQQQQHLAAVAASNKTPPTSNGSAYSEHLTSSDSVAAKFQNMLANFPQCYKQKSNSSSSPVQSPQWKNSTRTPTPQVPSSLSSSTTSSLKNHSQQQARPQQTHTQISFGGTQKSPAASHAQPPNNNPSPSPLAVGSPTHSSISKGASGSPRSITASTSNKTGQASLLSSQQAKNSPSVPSQKPSILGNPPITSSSSAGTKSQMQQQQQQQQQQFSKQTMQQTQLFFSNHYMQAQPPHSTSSTVSASSGYYLQRKRPEQQQQQSQQSLGSSVASSTGMLSLCPVSGSSASTSDPAKAVAAAAASATNTKGSSLTSHNSVYASQFGAQSSGNMHQQLPAGFSYVNAVPAAVQAKPAEQKQPAGEHSKD